MTQDRKITIALLGFALVFNLWFLRSEILVNVANLNDNVLHLVSIIRAAEAIRNGQDITDHWLPNFAMGYPFFHHYQQLGQVVVSLMSLIINGVAGIFTLFNWVKYLLLSLFPLSIYWSMRKLGFDRLPSALAGLIAPLISTDGLYGLEYGSYVWRGFGMYTQLWGMVLLPLALAYSHAALKEGKGYFKAILFLAATLLAHLIFGYIAVVSLVLFVFLKWERAEIWRRLKRLAVIGVLTGAVTSYFFIPLFLDRAYMNRSVWELPWKYASFGYQEVLTNLVRGNLMDFNRLPVLTILAGIGLLVGLRRREEKYRLIIAFFVLWLVLYFGRSTWGVLLSLLPLSADLPFHRLIAGVQLAAIIMAGIGLSLLWSQLTGRRGILRLVAVVGITALILAPVYQERQKFLEDNARWMGESEAAFTAESSDLAHLTVTLEALPPGRVYCGLVANWGGQYRVGSVPMYALLSAKGFDSLGFLYHALSLNADVQVLFDETNISQYELFNVRYVIAPAERKFPDFVRPLLQFGRHCLYQVETTGYFELVDSDIALTGTRDDWYTANSKWFKSELLAAGEHPSNFFGPVQGNYTYTYPMDTVDFGTLGKGKFNTTARGEVVSEKVGDNSYAAEVVVSRESYLMLKETYHPGWHGYVDGKEAGLVQLSPSFVGVKLAPGKHQVSMEYQPPAMRRPLLVLGIVVLVLLGLASWKKAKLSEIITGLRAAKIGAAGRAVNAAIEKVLVSSCVPEWLSANYLFVGGILLFAILACLPLFQFKMIGGHDSFGYLPRIVEFYQGLASGVIFPRWAADLGGGYGEPIFNATPPILYYITSFLHVIGFGFIQSMDMVLFLLLLICGLGMYFFAREFLGRYGGFAAAVGYMFAPYVMTDLYVRADAAEFAVFAFIPFVMWSIYRFCRDNDYRFFLLGAISAALQMLCSNAGSLIIFPVFALYIIFLAWRNKEKAYLLKGGACLAVGLMLSAFFWLPALLEKDFLKAAEATVGSFHYSNHFVYLEQLIYSAWGFGVSVPGPQDGMSFMIGPVHLLLLAVSIIVLKRVKGHSEAKDLVKFLAVMLVGAVFFTNGASQFIWDRIQLLRYLQFPWRFLIVPAVAVSFACGFPLLLADESRVRVKRIALAGVVLAIFLVNFSHAKAERFYDISDADYSPQQIAQGYVKDATVGEYQPIWVKTTPAVPTTEKLVVREGQVKITTEEILPMRYRFVVETGSGARLRVNTFYFPGWRIRVDGKETAIDYSNEYGVMEFRVGPGVHQVEVRFTDTPIRKYSGWLTVLGLILLIGVAAWLRRGRKRIEA